MKRLAGLVLSILFVFCVFFALPHDASAAETNTKEGIKVDIATDKNRYSADADIEIIVTITNENSYQVSNFSVETYLPKGLELITGNLLSTDITIPSGQTHTVSVKAFYNPSNSDLSLKVWLIVALVVFVIAVIVTIVLFVVSKSKKAAKVMSILLCATMLLSMLPMGVSAEEADISDTPGITVDKSITVDSRRFKISATVMRILDKDEVVPVEIAELFGVSPDAYDTDGDGLSNYVEIYMAGTNPTMVDTDEDEVTDANEDADEDGLLNIEELNIGTSLWKPDSDDDGLSDYRELKETSTDPLNYDTDGDTLSDGDELLLGLNPLEKKTDGITLDSERTFTQKLDSNNIDEYLMSEENDAIPSLTLTATGNINNRVVIAPTISNDFSDSRAVLGEPIDISGTDLGVGTLSFTLKSADTSYVESEDFPYNPNLICKYNADGSTEYLNTSFNEGENVLSAPLDGEGTYFVLNVQNLFDELGLPMPTVSDMGTYNGTLTAPSSVKHAAPRIQKTAVRSSYGVMAQADIVFLIDTTGSMGNEINNVKENIQFFVDALKEKGVSAGLALIDYQDINADGLDSTKVHKNGASNWFYDIDAYKKAISNLELGNGGDTPECAVDALETGRLLDMRASAGKIFILVTDAGYKVANRYDISSMAEEIELLKNANVTCAVVSPSSYQGTYFDLYTETNGVWANINGDFYAELMALADKIGTDIVGDGYWICLAGPVPRPVRLDAEPIAGSTVDTDGDGIYDIDELEGLTPTGMLDLNELVTRISYGAITGTDYEPVMMYKYKSSPVDEDTDFDGTNDDVDTTPKSNTFKGVLSNSFDEGINVDFTMDYRKLIDDSNSWYSAQKSTFACVLATLAYGSNIHLTSGAKTNGTIKDLYRALGLKDFADYSLSDTYDDDDVSEIIIGHRLVTFEGKQTEVFIVSVRGTNGTVEEWSSNFDVGADDPEYWDYNNTEWINREHHKGFDVTANRCYSLIERYISTGIEEGYISETAAKSIFITGHSRGAAITNLLGKKFEDDSSFISSAYGFATPNTTTSDNTGSYDTIFSVVNKDDLVPYLPLAEWGFAKYGRIKSASVEADYENKWFGAQEGTWEWLINANRKDGLDYNYNGHKQSTLDAFKKVAPTLSTASREEIRKSLYVRPYTEKSFLTLDNSYTTREEAEAAIETIKITYGPRLSRAADFAVIEATEGFIDKKTVYKIRLAQCPEFLMMSVASLAGSETPDKDLHDSFLWLGDKFGYKVAPLYHNAKIEFIHSAVDNAGEDGTILGGFVRFGGMTHGHWPETYYLLAKYLETGRGF